MQVIRNSPYIPQSDRLVLVSQFQKANIKYQVRMVSVQRGQILSRCRASLESKECPFFGLLRGPHEQAGSWSTQRPVQGCQVTSSRSGRARTYQGGLTHIFRQSRLIQMLVTDREQGWFACSRQGSHICSGIQYQSRCTLQIGVGLTFRPPVIETVLYARDMPEWYWHFLLQQIHEEWYYEKTVLIYSVRLTTYMWV